MASIMQELDTQDLMLANQADHRKKKGESSNARFLGGLLGIRLNLRTIRDWNNTTAHSSTFFFGCDDGQ